MESKVCRDCRTEKPVSEFGRDAARADGLQFYCRRCTRRRNVDVYRRKRERLGKTVRQRVDVPKGHKYCPGCATVKPYAQWHRNRRSRDGFASYCRDCRKVQGRADHLKRTFGLTPDQLAELVAAQGGLCAICHTGDPKHIDHDHATGRVRGVLCGPCNMGLGLFGDDPLRLQAAARYLRTPVRRPIVPVHVVERPPFAIELAGARLHAA